MFCTRYDAKPISRPKAKQRRTKEPAMDDVDLSLLLEVVGKSVVDSHSAYNFKYEWLSRNIMSKYVHSAASITNADRRERAIAKMLQSEAICGEINRIGYREHVVPDWFNGVMHYAKNFCANVLGEVDYSIFESARFSGGASTSRTRRQGDPYFKYGVVPPIDVTANALPYAVALIKCTPLWERSLNGKMPNITTGNRITTVPKNAEIDRCIAMEPDMNMALQLAVGKHIRHRLKRFGFDLNDQTHNQRLARIGSFGSLATIDLSSASDTISYRVVADLLPLPWFSLLDDLRAARGVLPDGTSVEWEKFSSMGNGFTFELETLIFASVCYGTAKMNDLVLTKENHAVYGDDIIVPTVIAQNLISALHCLGFTTNTDKTFTTGPFRESCGKHYYNGCDVTPFYIREPVNGLESRCRLANRIRGWSYDEHSGVCDPNMYDVWRHYAKQVPRKLRGGFDVARVDYLVSPGNPGDRIVRRHKQIRINGYRALLRWMQSIPTQNILTTHMSCSESVDNSVIVTDTVISFDFKSNDDWWLIRPLYSQEIIVGCD